MCNSTEPGHRTNLTGVKLGLALRKDRFRAPALVEILAIDGETITLALPDGTLTARCHDAQRLAGLRDAAGARGLRAQFTPHEHQLFVDVEPGPGVQYVSTASRTGALAAFNLALPWHEYRSCSDVRVSAGVGSGTGGR